MSANPTQTINRFGRQNRSSEFNGMKAVPVEFADRLRIRQTAAEEAKSLDPTHPLSRQTLQGVAHRVLQRTELPKQYLGYSMVMLSNAFATDRLRAVPFNRRLLLLPRCLRSIQPAGETCLAGSETFDGLRVRAEALGYQVLVADGVPVVVKVLGRADIDAIIGVACLDSLEAAFDTIWRLGIPAVAVPLLNDNCSDTATDLDWLSEYVEGHTPDAPAPHKGYLPVLRAAAEMFAPDRLAGWLDGAQGQAHGGALSSAGNLAVEWLATGGKRLRPFITLAAAAAVSGQTDPAALTPAAYRVALAIEAFHKASLVHDDIEDDDDVRYGHPTLHRVHGIPTAINVGDYLLGLGYRLVSLSASDTPAAAAVLGALSRAHVHLAQGQGAELAWRNKGELAPAPQEVLKVYALKTAPAFEAALTSGILVADGDGEQDKLLETFSRHVGVGYQVLNDLEDWTGDCRATRPTYLTASAVALAPAEQRDEILDLIARVAQSDEALECLGERMEQLGAFDQARDLVERLKQRACILATQVQPEPLSRLCGFLSELILTRGQRQFDKTETQ